MHVASFTLTLLTMATWLLVLVLVRNSLVTKTSIHLNISANKNTNFIRSESLVKSKKKYHVPKFMLELYERNKADSNGPDVVRSLIPKHAVQEPATDHHLLVFDLPNPAAEEEFVSAELRILTLVEVSASTGVERKLTVSVYNDLTESFRSLHQVHIRHCNNTWLSFNVTGAVVEILHAHRERALKVVIAIDALDAQENKLALSLMPVAEDLDHDYPVLLLSYTSGHSRNLTRTKRSVEEDYEEETNRVWDDDAKKIQPRKSRRGKNTCRRKPLYINFSDIAFDLWIVQPKGYEAYQCHGRCFYPVAEHLSPTKHAIVQALLHSVSPAKVSRSCCVPTRLDSISILYVDPAGVLTYRYAYKDMVVIECGCR